MAPPASASAVPAPPAVPSSRAVFTEPVVVSAWKAIKKHTLLNDWNWPMIIYLSLAHTAAVAGAVVLCSGTVMWQTMLWAFLLWPMSGLGITAGAHRLWAHRSYKASTTYRWMLMLLNSVANQGSIYHWSRDHRVHHKHSETDGDPHNATRGFFYAHMGWLLVRKHKDVIKAGKDLDFSDLLTDPAVAFQRRFDPWFALFMCFGMPGLVSMLWGESFWNGYLVAGALRYVWVLHMTWLVNSAAHFYGDHPYDPAAWPAENPLVSLGAIGEGWHSYHHRYPFDYSASEYGWLYQFNPTTAFLDACASIGMVWDRKRATGAWNKLKETRARQIAAEADAAEPLKSDKKDK